MPPDSKQTKLGSSDQEASPSAGKNNGVVLAQSLWWKCAPTAISGGLDISEVPGSHLLQWSSQWGWQKLLLGLVPHELTVCFSIFNLFKLNELWQYYQKHIKQIILNHTTLWSLALQIFEAFIQILLIVNLSLNQTLQTFLVCVSQTWMTQLILEISLWEAIFI